MHLLLPNMKSMHYEAHHCVIFTVLLLTSCLLGLYILGSILFYFFFPLAIGWVFWPVTNLLTYSMDQSP